MSKGPSRPKPKRGSVWCTQVGGLAGHPVLAAGMKPDGPVHSHAKSKYLELPHHLRTYGIYHHKTSRH